jgi:hypothetical protein
MTMTATIETTYNNAIDILRKRVDLHSSPEAYVLNAIESAEIRKVIQKHHDKMLIGIHHTYLDNLDFYPISFELRTLPPNLAFFPTLVTAVIRTSTGLVTEVFEIGETPILIKGNKSLPDFRNALESASKMFGADSQFPFGYIHVLGAAMLPWAELPPKTSAVIDAFVNGANPWLRMCCVNNKLQAGTFPWEE